MKLFDIICNVFYTLIDNIINSQMNGFNSWTNIIGLYSELQIILIKLLCKIYVLGIGTGIFIILVIQYCYRIGRGRNGNANNNIGECGNANGTLEDGNGNGGNNLQLVKYITPEINIKNTCKLL